MIATRFRLLLGGEERFGYAEDGWAAAPLPAACPASCTIEWGEPDAQGRFPFHAEVALDCHGPDSLSGMLHNLGYPKRLPLDTRASDACGRRALRAPPLRVAPRRRDASRSTGARAKPAARARSAR